MNVIEVRNLSKAYAMYSSQSGRLLEHCSFGKIQAHTDFFALRDISFDVEAGSTIGIIGQNGAGKSTLLSILAGVSRPTCGRYSVQGKTMAILELGSGFHPEFTGRENVYMYGSIIGLSKKEIDSKFDDIIEFSELHDFIDQPLRTYSSGMVVRLAFSVATHVDSDILIIDEALAVGDALFQHRCIGKIKSLQRAGKTILYVGHDMDAVRNLCTNAILLDGGKVIKNGDTNTVVNTYQALLHERDRLYRQQHAKRLGHKHETYRIYEQRTTQDEMSVRYGPKDIEILHVQMLDSKLCQQVVFQSGDEVRIRVTALMRTEIKEGLNIGFIVRNRFGEVYGMNSYWLEEDIGRRSYAKGERITVDFIQQLNLGTGLYRLTVAPAITISEHDSTIHDWINDVYVFEVVSQKRFMGIVNLHSRMERIL